MTTTTISFEASKELKNEVKKRAKQEMRSQSSFIRKTLTEHLNLSKEGETVNE